MFFLFVLFALLLQASSLLTTQLNNYERRSNVSGNFRLARQVSTASQDITSITSDTETNWELKLFSPAKINLFLRILKRRSDGYHELASLFQTVAFGDQLHISKLDSGAETDEFTCNTRTVPSGKKNLVIRALKLFREKAGVDQYFKVHLEKVIPSRAGMGGGSGDAATTLFAANELTGCPATSQELELWSASLGSDVTFFFSQGTCYCTGRGEILNPQPNMEPCKNVWLIKPEQGLSTPLVFKNLNYQDLSTEDPANILQTFRQGLTGATFINDLEPPAFKTLPLLKEIKQEIQEAGFETVLMSGSGTTIFALGMPQNREWPIEFVKKWGCNIWRTEFINRPSDEHLWYKQEIAYNLPQK